MKKLPRSLRNKYVVSTLIFSVWVGVFSDIDAWFMFKKHRELSRKKAELEKYEHQTAQALQALEELSSDSRNIEKFAREQYFMKRENEDVFVIRRN
jgi:cell division protein DivIC